MAEKRTTRPARGDSSRPTPRKLDANTNSRAQASNKQTSAAARSSAGANVSGERRTPRAGHAARTDGKSTARGSKAATKPATRTGAQGHARTSSTKGAAPSARASAPTRQKRASQSAKTRDGAPARARQTAPGQTYNKPTLWTKGATASKAEPTSVVARIVQGIAHVFGMLFSLIGRAFSTAGHGVISLMHRSRVAAVCVVVLAVVLVGCVADLGFNWGKVHAGVHVGEVDLSGKTEQEARTLIEDVYAARLADHQVVIYSNDDVRKAVESSASEPDVPLATRAVVAEAAAAGSLWVSDAASLGATLDVDGMVTRAMAVGRDDGGVLARIQAAFGGWTVEACAAYEAGSLEALASAIDAAIGNPRVDFGVAVDAGVARVTEGHDGTMVDREKFAHAIDGALLSADGGAFVASADYAPLRITADEASKTCEEVNAALAVGVQMTAAGYGWTIDAAELGSWTVATVEPVEGVANTYALLPHLDAQAAAPSMLAQAKRALRDSMPNVSFAREGDAVVVTTDGSGLVALPDETVSLVDEALFGTARDRIVAASHAEGDASAQASDAKADEASSSPEASEGSTAGQPTVAVATTATPTSLTFDEALSRGLVEEISTYTTTYLNTAASANRRHNIHLAADLLNDSIVPANGGKWSFYGTAGECNEAAGFLGAGVIVDGEHTDDIGGGVCQVATTVFNAVYESGLPIDLRYNHTLRMTNYPDGRDAAVAWPDLDLQWSNDCSSDVLVRCSYTDESLTVTLYGVDPNYTVSTDTGEWQEGEPFQTKVECDESMAEGASYVKSAGINGSLISVVRTVRAEDGTVVRESTFSSKYESETKVVVAGPNTKVQVGDEELVATPGKTVTSKKTAA